MNDKVVPIAENVIEAFGGASTLAEVLGINISNVYRMKEPKSKGGRGGYVPAKYQTDILKAAKDRGIEISEKIFFDLESDRTTSN